MGGSADQPVTVLLRQWRAGDEAAGDQLMRQVYEELHRLAAHHLRTERPGHTLRPTDLVSEAYLRLAGSTQPEWDDRTHFFALAARTMRQILVDHARRRCAEKRAPAIGALPFDDALAAAERPEHLVAIDDALADLARIDPRKVRVIELSYFGGLSQHEIATVLGVHVNTVARELRLAEAWLHREITRP